MFRFLRLTNLRSTRRRSASCPNLERVSGEDELQENNIHKNSAYKSSSESDSNEADTPNKFERLKAQQSVRRGHLKEKEKKENTEKNLISMGDYLGKLSELKIWLKEERKKDVDNMRSPKLKAHFKTFVKLWNKRKLPLKYYRGCAVNLYIDDKSSSTNLDTAKILINPPYSLAEDSAKYSATVLLPPFDLSCDNVMEDVTSPFSTFGKCEDVLTSPTVLTEKVNMTSPFGKQEEKNSSQKSNKYNMDKSSPGGSPTKFATISRQQGDSPTKFATISRSIPVTSRLHNFTPQPWSPRVDVIVNQVPDIKCPDSQSHFAASAFSGSPSVTSLFSHSYKPAGENMNKTNTEQLPCVTKSSRPSPVYSSIVDAIPYSTGSPKYAEIDETIQSPLQKIPSTGYCSLSPLQEWRLPYTNVKQPVSKKQSLSRRRSKSLEDLYTVPFKADICVKVTRTLDEEDPGPSKTPPIPDRKYNQAASASTCSDQRDIESATLKDYSKCSIAPFKTSPLSSRGSGGSQKRRSQEDIESDQHSTSSLKKTKSALLSDSDIENSMLSATENENASPQFSILTGSLNPTTRSRYNIHESVKTPKTSTTKCLEPRLSILEIKQLDESPKLPRRKLKRRSSSLSTTPGKGLLFGKSSKMSLASPKRVSFAKNVKETEKTPKPGKLFALRRCTPQNFTTQTKERKQFESFLSSHESPPRKSNSPNKVPSPDKNSPLNTSTPTKRNSPQKNLNDNVTPVISESQDNIPRKRLFDCKEKDNESYNSQVSTSSLSDVIQADRIFPPSSTRQVGRRVIGAPRASPSKSIVGTNQTPSPKKNLQDPSHAVSPQKNIPTACPAPSNMKSLTATSHLYSPKKNLGVSSQLDSPQKYKESTVYLTSHTSQENLGSKNKVVSPDKNTRYATNSASLYHMRISSSSLPATKYQAAISPQKHPKSPPKYQAAISPQKHSKSPPKYQAAISPQKHPISPPKSDSQLKELTRQHSATKKLFDSSVIATTKSIHSLITKLTEKTTTICASELSQSDDCLSSDEILSLASESNSSEISPLFTDPPKRESQNQDLNKENGDFKVAVLESSPGSKTKETDSHLHRTPASCTEVTSVKESHSYFHHTSKASSTHTAMSETDNPPHHLYMKQNSPSSLDKMNNVQSRKKTYLPDSLPVNKKCSIVKNSVKTNSTANELFNQPVYATSSGCEMKDIRQHMSEEPIKRTPSFHLAVNYHTLEHQHLRENSFQTKEIPTEVEAFYINTCTDGGNDIAYQKCGTDIQTLQDTLKSSKTCSITTPLEVDRPENSSLGPKLEHSYVDNLENSASVLVDKNGDWCDLKRISSIRASPKIVDNDGWITERRRSSKGKSLHSFRSAYNRVLLKSSIVENELEMEPLAIENVLPWTPDFVVVSTGENISLDITENVQGMSKKSNEILSNGMSIDKNGQHCGVSTEKKSIASPAKIKPPTLPKPSKASLLVNRKLTTATNVISITSKAASKRRSSLARRELAVTPCGRRELTVTPSGRNFNESNKISSRVSIGKDKSRDSLSGGKDKSRDSLSGGKDKSSKRVSSGRRKLSTKKYNEHDTCLESSEQEKSLGKDSDVPVPGYSQSISGIHKGSDVPVPGYSQSISGIHKGSDVPVPGYSQSISGIHKGSDVPVPGYSQSISGIHKGSDVPVPGYSQSISGIHKGSDVPVPGYSQSISGIHKESSKFTSSSHRLYRPQQPRQTNRKRSSNGAGDSQQPGQTNRRRRSNGACDSEEPEQTNRKRSSRGAGDSEQPGQINKRSSNGVDDSQQAGQANRRRCSKIASDSEQPAQTNRRRRSKIACDSEEPGQTNRRRSSKVAGDSHMGRRRSKVKSVAEETKILSFAEKKMYFTQLHMNVKTANDRNLGINCQAKDSPQNQNQPVKFATGRRHEIKSKAETLCKTLLLPEKMNPSSSSDV